MIKIAALWKSEKCLSGPIDGAVPMLRGLRLVVMKNEKKGPSGKGPEYLVFLAEPRTEENSNDNSEDTPF